MNIKYHILNWLISVILLIGSLTPSAAQCYEQLTDASGMSMPDEMVTRINQAACEIKQILNLSGGETFKVYTYGFYAHAPQTYFGLQEARSCALSQAQQSDYYILIGKETDGDGLFKRYDISFLLPDTGPFNCLKDAKRTELQNIMNQAGTDAAAENRIVPSPEVILRETKEYLEILKNCSTCATGNGDGCLRVSFKGIDKMLTGLKFRKISVTVAGDQPWTMGQHGIYDHVQKNINIPLEGIGTVHIPDQIYESKIQFESGADIVNEDTTINVDPINGKVFIFKNENFVPGEEWDDMQDEADNLDYVECWVLLRDEQNHYWLYSRFSFGKFDGESWDGSAARGDNVGSRAITVPTPFGIALNFIGNAALDAIIQTVGNRILDQNARNQPTELGRWLKSWDKVDKKAALWEGVSSLLPWQKAGVLQGALLRAATSALAVVIDHATSENYPNYSVKDGLLDFSITFGTSSLTQLIAQKFKLNNGPRLISIGLNHWYENASKGVLKKLVFHVSKVYDDFTTGIVKAGKYIEQEIAISNVKKIDLMGGKKSQLGGDFVNIDLSDKIEKGIKGDATKLSKFLPSNSVDEIVCNNPYLGATLKAEDYIKEVALIIKSGKKVYVNGQYSNKYFKGVNQALAQKYGFVIEQFQVPLLPQFKNIKFTTTDGKPLVGDVISTVIRKL